MGERQNAMTWPRSMGNRGTQSRDGEICGLPALNVAGIAFDRSTVFNAIIMIVRGVIFDMDGTLTRPYLDFRALRDRLGVGEVDLIAYLADAPAAERVRVERILAEFEQDGVDHAELNPGALELLDALRQRGLPTGLLTRNSRRSVEAVCRKFGLAFDTVFTRDEAPSKPSPEPVWRMATTWSVNPSEILVVGDYKWDMICAHNAGAKSVWLSNGDTMPAWANEADYTIDSLSELTVIIEGTWAVPSALTGGSAR